MNYNATIEYLYRQMPAYQRVGASAYKEGLDNSLALDKYFNHPHKHYKTIHVGGTNGKGSTSHVLASILQDAGYKVGLYTSPHLIDFRERIRVNGEMIDKEFVVEFVAKHKEFFEPIEPSFFELTMEMAFLYFKIQNVDVAIIEVGLGGRLDSTNIISPDLSIITNIGFDHMSFLGNTLPEIAYEKAGIIKKEIPVVIGEAEGNIADVFSKKALEESAPILYAEKEYSDISSSLLENGQQFSTSQYGEIECELGGVAQIKNARTVMTAVKVLSSIGYKIEDANVKQGFKNVCKTTGLLGRWQILGESPKIVCDTAHNAHGIKHIVQQLASSVYEKLHIVIGVVGDKDSASMLTMLPKNAIYYFTRPSIERALNENTLSATAHKLGLKGETYPSVEEAIISARSRASEKDFIFIGGSSFVVSDALPLFMAKQ